MRHRSFVAGTVLVLLGSLVYSSPASAETVGTIDLAVGQHRHWKGPYIENVEREGMPLTDVAPYACETLVQCWEYHLDVPEGGDRLRVAIDTGTMDDLIDLYLLSPTGERYSALSYFDSAEIIVWDRPWTIEPEAPPQLEVGTWRLLLYPFRADRVRPALRALVEKQPNTSSNTRNALLPDLRAEAPYGFRFGCAPEDTPRDDSPRCLRFSFGYHNAGKGPYEIKLAPRLDDPLTADARQLVYYDDESPWNLKDNPTELREETSGTATWHEFHNHWHYDNIVEATLLERTADGLQPVGAATKRGACAHDWLMVDFARFYQDPRTAYDSGDRCNGSGLAVLGADNVPRPGKEVAIALSTGWADVYTAGLSDNYIDFPKDARHGTEYVLRTQIDASNLLQEIDDTDNFGYAHIRYVEDAEGTRIELLERGRGMDPWDRDRVIVTGLGE